jgi:hypothetical protein
MPTKSPVPIPPPTRERTAPRPVEVVTLPDPPPAEPALVSLEALLDVLDLQPMARLDAARGEHTSSAFYSRNNRARRWQRVDSVEKVELLASFLTRHTFESVSLSPLGHRGLSRHGPISATSAFWCSVPVNLREHPFGAPVRWAPTAADKADARGRIASAAFAPSFSIHGGHRLVAVWLLSASLNGNLIELQKTLHRLHAKLGVPVRTAIQPADSTWPVPGSLAVGLIPQTRVRVEAASWPPPRYDVRDLQTWLDGGG